MDDQLQKIAQRVEELSRALRTLEDRIDELESRTPPASEPDIEDLLPSLGEGAADEAPLHIALIGKAVLILAGAFLLRMVTNSAYLPPALGVLAGLIYAALWMVLADRKGRQGDDKTAAYYCAVAVAIVNPLIWEATTKFGILSPSSSALILLLSAVAVLLLADRRKLQAAGWFTVGASVATAIVLSVQTRHVLPYVWALLGVGLLTLWLSRHETWAFLDWPVAAAVDLGLLALIRLVTMGKSSSGAGATSIALLALVAIYFGAPKLMPARRDGCLVQIAAAVMIGLGGIVILAAPHSALRLALGTIVILYALVAYVVAEQYSLGPSLESRIAWSLHQLVALALAVAGLALVSGGTVAGLLFTSVAIGQFWWGRAEKQQTFLLHGTAMLFLAAVYSGLVSNIAHAWLRPLVPYANVIDFAGIVVLVASLGAFLMIPVDDPGYAPSSRYSAVSLLILLAASFGAIACSSLTIALASSPGGVDKAALAAIRTGVLAFLAISAAVAGHSMRFRIASALVYPLLIATGIKLLVEDLPVGRPSTLFLGLAIFGGTLIIAPRVRVRISSRADKTSTVIGAEVDRADAEPQDSSSTPRDCATAAEGAGHQEPQPQTPRSIGIVTEG